MEEISSLIKKNDVSEHVFFSETNYYIVYLFQTTLVLQVKTESKLVSRNAANAIFTLDSLRILTLLIGLSVSEEFFKAMAETSSNSKVLSS